MQCCIKDIDKMKVRWLGVTHFLGLTYGKMYEVLSVEKGWDRVGIE